MKLHKLLALGWVALAPVSSFAALITQSVDLTTGNALLTQSGVNAGGLGNTWSVTVNGVTITMTAFNLSTAANSTFTAAQITPFSTGLGVCNANEKAANASCSADPQHRVDNNGSRDFVLFQFSRPVDVDSVVLSGNASYPDSDISYWNKLVPGAPISLLNLNLTTMNLGSELTETGAFATTRTATIANNWSDTFLVAAKIDETNDYFKIRTINFSYDTTRPTSDTGVPEPATYFTLGGALLGLAFYRRSRKGNLQ